MQETYGAFDLPTEATQQNSPAATTIGRKGYWYLFRFSLFLLLVPFTSYSTFMATDADKQQALLLETAVHQQMANGDFDGIYNDSSREWQSAISRERSNAYFAAVATKWGSPQECTQSNTGVRNWIQSRIIRSQCTTTFSGGHTAVETFKWKKTESGYRLFSYVLRRKPQ